MKRRTVLSIAGCSLLAGCLISGQGSSEGYQSIQISEIQADEISKKRNIKISVEKQQNFTNSAPGKVAVEFTNTSDQVHTFQFGATPPFSSFVGQQKNGEAQMILVPDDREYIGIVDVEGGSAEALIPRRPQDGCWKAQNGIAGNDILQNKELNPGESIEMAYTALAHYLNDGCMNTGGYRFVSRDYFDDGSPWGFTITMEKAES